MEKNNQLFDALGFYWDRDVLPKHARSFSVERACFRFHRMLPEFVWDASMLENNPFSFPEVQTLLDGVTVGGHQITDQEQVLNLAKSSRLLISTVKKGLFRLDKAQCATLQAIVARGEAMDCGYFRGEGEIKHGSLGVAIGLQGSYRPWPNEPGAPELNRIFSEGIQALTESVDSTLERGCAMFMFGALQQFFFDGNKRTARFMMNGILMSEGIDAISIPARRQLEFNEKMCDFYVSRDATAMMAFLIDCHPDAEWIYENQAAVALAASRKLSKDDNFQP